MQHNFKYPRMKQIHQFLEKITRIDQKVKILCVLLSRELYSTRIILHINLHNVVIIQVKTNSKIQKLLKSNKYIKSYIQKVLLFWLTCFLFVIKLNLPYFVFFYQQKW